QVRMRSPTSPSGKRSTPVPMVWIQRTPRRTTLARFGLPQARVRRTSPLAPGGGSPSIGTSTISTPPGSPPASSSTDARGTCESTRSGRESAGASGSTATRLRASSGRRPHADRRRPGALLVRREAVVVEGRTVVPVAGLDVDAVSVRVEGAAQVGGVHGERRLLDRADVVDGLAGAGRELGVVELDCAARGIRRAREGAPGIVDQPLERLAGPDLRADPHHLEARDAAPPLARVVALAAAEPLEALGGE